MPPRHDPSWCLFGTSAIRGRLASLARETDCVSKGEDAECIHRMRVASRRLTTALGLFETCLPPRRFKAWTRRIRRLRRALGAARDTDVQIEFVAGFLQGLGDETAGPGLERLLLRLRQKRAALQGDVRRALERLQESRAIGELRTRLRRVAARAKEGGTDPRAAPVYILAEGAVVRHLGGLLEFERFVHRPKCADELHAMRIAAKHLRYTMEVFKDLYPDELKPFIRAARQAQTLLGELHDLDVWVAWLPQFLADERDRTIEFLGDEKPLVPLAKGIHFLAKHCGEARAAKHAEFAAFWDALRKEGAWDRLRETLRYRPATAAPAPGDGDAAPDEPRDVATLVSPPPDEGADSVPPDGPTAPPDEAPPAPPEPQA